MRISDWSSDVCSSDLFPTIGTQLRFFPAFIVQRRQIRTEFIGRIAKCLFAMWHQCIAKFANTLLSKLIKRTARLANRIESDRSSIFPEFLLCADCRIAKKTTIAFFSDALLTSLSFPPLLIT